MRFRQQLQRSQLAVDAVAEHYRQRGLAVTVPALRIRPTLADRKAYSDHGDLFAGFHHRPAHRIEVKWRRLDFTAVEDFPYRTMNIDRVNKSGGLAYLYLQVNYTLTHAAMVHSRTRPSWQIDIVNEPRRGYSDYQIYRCPKGVARFFRLLRKPIPTPPPWQGRCHCGNPGLYVGPAGWACNEHRIT
jgi:hypothetical protein